MNNINNIYIITYMEYKMEDCNKASCNKIYVHGFWNGFVDKTDANHIEYFIRLFSHTKLAQVEITRNINEATILFESVFANSLVMLKPWKLTIGYSGEPYIIHDKYDIFLDSHITENQYVDLPLAIYYIHGNNFMPRLLAPPNREHIPDKFCCFIVSNGRCQYRNTMFHLLNQYKKVDSLGKYLNNVEEANGISYGYWTPEYMNLISSYKFIICFENSKQNTYITEKIVNPFLARIIPIYWATHHVKNVFNMDAMLFLEDESKESYIRLIERIIELDTDDTKYLEFVNRDVFTENNIKYIEEHYSYSKIAENMDKNIKF